MPANQYRVEIRLSREMKSHLEKIRSEFIEAKNSHVSMNELIVGIIEQFLEKEQATSFRDENGLLSSLNDINKLL